MTDPVKVTADLCREKAAEARLLKQHTQGEPPRIMLEHIADTWDRLAKRLTERNGGSARW